MSTIGSLVFCTMCGSLLPASKGTVKGILRCDSCQSENRDMASQTITTETKATDFPSLLRQKLQSTVKTVASHEISTMATISERCAKCGAEEVRYTSVQLRSADEGSTIFYYCDCGHNWATNN
ncbi:DNA-directed RNA polymerase I core subunit rpa12 [Ceratocystis pirilliformis]|uniref:DNA-directed RNA polymerase subunit n=3 Tax=Ceratocystis TaxID=5157 RepID=A0A2C5XKE6_9PEZI|nr:DNA-directed RNA polymerase I subunit RPA12 [Ceratocystis fimbriata CBS 114723]